MVVRCHSDIDIYSVLLSFYTILSYSILFNSIQSNNSMNKSKNINKTNQIKQNKTDRTNNQSCIPRSLIMIIFSKKRNVPELIHDHFLESRFYGAVLVCRWFEIAFFGLWVWMN